MNYAKGINLGGWLSQYDVNETEKFDEMRRRGHFDSFIVEKDIERIACWGADHIRLPVDAEILLESDGERHFAFIDCCVCWCEKHELDIILDVHEIQGHIYGQMDELVPLLKRKELRQRLIGLWEALAERYKGVRSPDIIFELLNEISDATGGYAWNMLCEQLISAIRKIDPTRKILVGSNNFNSVFELNALRTYDDPNIAYNFHFYEPQIFTHQKAHFCEDLKQYGKTVHYPGSVDGFLGFLAQNPQFAQKYGQLAFVNDIDKGLLEQLVRPAKYFCEYHENRLHCGEFGVINNADNEDICSYCKDMVCFYKEYGIGYSYWTYKEMDFGIVDREGKTINPQLIPILFQGKR